MFKFNKEELNGVLTELHVSDNTKFGISVNSIEEAYELLINLKDNIPNLWRELRNSTIVYLWNKYENYLTLYPYTGYYGTDPYEPGMKIISYSQVKVLISHKLRAKKIDTYKNEANGSLTNVYLSPLFTAFLKDVLEEKQYNQMIKNGKLAQKEISKKDFFKDVKTIINEIKYSILSDKDKQNLENAKIIAEELSAIEDYDEEDCTVDSDYSDEVEDVEEYGDYNENKEESVTELNEDNKESNEEISEWDKMVNNLCKYITDSQPQEKDDIEIKGYKITPDKIVKMTDEECEKIFKVCDNVKGASQENLTIDEACAIIAKMDKEFAKMGSNTSVNDANSSAPALEDIEKNKKVVSTLPKTSFKREDIKSGDILIRRDQSVEIAISEKDLLVLPYNFNRISELPEELSEEAVWGIPGIDVVAVFRTDAEYEIKFDILERIKIDRNDPRFLYVREGYSKDEEHAFKTKDCWISTKKGTWKCHFCGHETIEKTRNCSSCGSKNIFKIKK